jgi:uncharacterized membrane protein
MNQLDFKYSLQKNAHLPFSPKTLLLGAGVLAIYGLSRRSKTGVALATAGGVIAFKAAKSQASAIQKTKATFLVNTSAEKAYQLWRNFENLPRFMAHLQSVRTLDDRRSEWVAQGPMDREIRWRAEVTEDRSGKRIGWQSLPGSDVHVAGSVDFHADPLGRGTFVTARINYTAPAGSVGTALAKVVGKNPEFMVREDLRRFKALLESGETPTTAGQTHGPRGLHGHAEQVLFREKSNQAEPQTRRPLVQTA